MLRIGILGATGYTAGELIRLLLNHPQAKLTRLTSRDESRPHLSSVHPSLRGHELSLAPFEIDDFKQNVDFAFSCLPHAASAEKVRLLLEADIRVVDFSADYRLDCQQLFERKYQVEHPDPQRLGSVPYGLPEFFRQQICETQLVANPGCFPTSILLPLCPLIKHGLLSEHQILIADSKTGISGAGRKASLKFHFPEANESVAAYSIGTHRHTPEIENVIKRYSGRAHRVSFTPHLIPMDRGILSTIYLPGDHPPDMASTIRTHLDEYFRDEPFVRMVDSPPATKHVCGTNRCHLFVGEDRGQPIIVSAIDNLLKGASGAAVQNFNLMNGLDETTGLQT